MDCNKDEACRAKEIAISKLEHGDFQGAKRLAEKAQNLYPQLEGISSLLTVLELHISATFTRNGLTDWYKVMGVNPLADKQAIAKQFRRLALIVHPDKNGDFSSTKAFRILCDAYDVLKDDTIRSFYDRRVNFPSFSAVFPPNAVFGATPSWEWEKTYPSRDVFQGMNPPASTSVAPPHGKSTKVTKQKSQNDKRSASASRNGVDGVGSFVAARPKKRTQSQNTSQTEGRSSFWTRCSGCKMGFEFPLEVLDQHLQCPNCPVSFHALETEVPQHFLNEPLEFSSSGDQSKNPPSAPQPTNMVDPSTEKKRRKANTDANSENKRRKINNAAGPEKDQSGRKMEADAAPKPARHFSSSDTRKMLIDLAFLSVSKKLESWRSASEDVASAPKENGMSVPDSDFHDFDRERTCVHFKKNDMWAVYDDDDGMPRLYAVIRKVVSLNPFKLEISWLNSKTSVEFGTMEWISQGFTKTCGKFRAVKTILADSSNIFSHKVECKKGPRGVIQVYPAKGDVWVLYKNWSPDWTFETPETVRHVYEVVEVVTDYTDEEGVSVIPLVKAAGFHTVFSKADLNEARRISKEEMFRFSHQIPRYMLSEKEAPNAPGGCLELDPASLSEELLQVIPAADSINTNS